MQNSEEKPLKIGQTIYKFTFSHVFEKLTIKDIYGHKCLLSDNSCIHYRGGIYYGYNGAISSNISTLKSFAERELETYLACLHQQRETFLKERENINFFKSYFGKRYKKFSDIEYGDTIYSYDKKRNIFQKLTPWAIARNDDGSFKSVFFEFTTIRKEDIKNNVAQKFDYVYGINYCDVVNFYIKNQSDKIQEIETKISFVRNFSE